MRGVLGSRGTAKESGGDRGVEERRAAASAERLPGAVRRAGAGVQLPGLRERGQNGLLWRNGEEGTRLGERGARVLRRGLKEKLSGVGRLGSEGR